MALYRFFRFNKNFYRIVYNASQWNHEKKWFRKKLSQLLIFIDKFFLLIPLIFLLNEKFPNFIPLQNIVAWPIFKSLHYWYSYNSYLYWGISVFLFISSSVYRNTTRVYDNEALMASRFHSVNHKNRNFVDSVIKKKKDAGIFVDLLFNGNSQVFAPMYMSLIKEYCSHANEAMSRIINDNDCYISLKLINSEVTATGKTMLTIRHIGSYPDHYPDKHLTNHTIEYRHKNPPHDLFQKIVNLFITRNEDLKHESWRTGIISNDLKGDESFDQSLVGDYRERYKSCIILPITIEGDIFGFLCFNSSKIGNLRKKHKHFLAGYCDEIANLFRTIPNDLPEIVTI